METIYWLLGVVVFLQLFGIFLNIWSWGSRLEAKVTRIMRHLGIDPFQLSDRVKELAKDPTKKIQAIAAYREETGKSLKEAKDAVEFWISVQGR